ncbi:MAG: ferredoxin:thioredoxin reductase [Candidatus Aenigmarchaeota archaeon]|nr:ferredoxin:thioredoxin reductase [Candidatus Aenigmarchaeota archaeon]
MNEDDLKRVWKKFAENNDFVLNPDEKLVDMVAKGVLANEEKHGLKLCPCRLRDGTKETDLTLICPCNFKVQEIWAKEGRCWCGLFVKKSGG